MMTVYSDAVPSAHGCEVSLTEISDYQWEICNKCYDAFAAEEDTNLNISYIIMGAITY